MQADVADHRLCCRTYITSGLPAFLYWNMQYHIEHHMFPNVPGFNLPKLRKLIEHDLPPAPCGLRATWKGMLEIHRKMQMDENYFFVPDLPADPDGDIASDTELSLEASGVAT
jgi:fatty acid desaturase